MLHTASHAPTRALCRRGTFSPLGDKGARCQSQQPPHPSPRSPQAPELGYRPSSGWLFLAHEYHVLGADTTGAANPQRAPDVSVEVGPAEAKEKAGLRLDGGRNGGDPLPTAGCCARSRASHRASPGQSPRVEFHLLLSYRGRQPAVT